MTTPPADAEEPTPADPSPGEPVEDGAAGGSTATAKRRIRMTRSTYTLVLAAVLLVGFVVVAATRPVPYVSLAPGPTFNTLGEYDGKPLISISGHKVYPTSGNLDLTTVSESGGPYGRLGLGEALRGWLDPDIAVVPSKLLHPPGVSGEEVEERNRVDFADAEDSATIAAFNYLDIPFDYVVRVSSVEDGSPADGKLEVGDVVLTVDGQKATTVEKTRDLIRGTGKGESATVTVRRDGKERDIVVTPQLREQDGTKVPVVGVTLGEDYESDVEVTYSLTGVGGPSAGLMFALGVVDKLSPESVNHGEHVAGTGTIAPDGKVGPIGGIQQKMTGARDKGATVFLVPADNCAAAKGAVPDGLTIAKVTTLTSAIEALDALHAGRPAPAC